MEESNHSNIPNPPMSYEELVQESAEGFDDEYSFTQMEEKSHSPGSASLPPE